MENNNFVYTIFNQQVTSFEEAWNLRCEKIAALPKAPSHSEIMKAANKEELILKRKEIADQERAINAEFKAFGAWLFGEDCDEEEESA